MPNKIYHFLDNDSWLESQLTQKTRMELARELEKELREKLGPEGPSAQVLFGCITQRMNTRFSEEKIKTFKRGRAHNKGKE